MKKILLIILFSPIQMIYGQSSSSNSLIYDKTNFTGQFVPTIPKVSSLGKFGNTPVNLYHGIPDVKIPLIDFKSRGLKLPIYLQYQSTGTKVEDVAGWVGMGWKLHAGGAITRQLKGLPDETENKGYFYVGDEVANFENLSEEQQKNLIVGSTKNYTEEGSMDTEPDVFYFNTGKLSGKFVFDHNQNIRLIPYQNIEIEKKIVNHQITEFTITDKDGFIYTFGKDIDAIEKSLYSEYTIPIQFEDEYQFWQNYPFEPYKGEDLLYYVGSVDPELVYDRDKEINLTHDYFNTTWYLKKIVSPLGDYINFSYSNVGKVERVTSPRITSIMPVLAFPGVVDFKPANPNPGSVPDYDKPTEIMYTPDVKSGWGEAITVNQSKISVLTKRLTKIEAANGNYVLLRGSNEREDLKNGIGPKLNDIIFYSNEDESIKSFELNYEIVVSETLHNDNDPFSLPEALLFKDIAFDPSDLNNEEKGIPANKAIKYESMVADGLAKEYLFEGLKHYNYKRLFLTSVKEHKGNQSLPPYIFEYYDSQKLGRRTSLLKSNKGYSKDTPFGLRLVSEENNQKLYTIKGILPPAGSAPLRGVISKVIYPTGGYTTYEYVDNYSSAGVRVSKIIDYDLMGSVINVKYYEYIYSKFTSGVKFKSYQNFYKYTGEIFKNEIRTSYNQYEPTAPNYISHKRVRVYHSKSVSEKGGLGFDEYYYIFPSSILSQTYTIPKEMYYPEEGEPELKSVFKSIFPYPNPTFKNYQGGLLDEHNIYDEDGDLIKKIDNVFKFNPDEFTPTVVKGLKGAYFYDRTKEDRNFWNGDHIDAEYRYRGGLYKHISEWYKLDYTITETYDQNDPTNEKKLTTRVDYEYDPEHLQVKEIITTDSEDNQITTKLTYSADFDYTQESEAERQACFDQYEQAEAACYDAYCAEFGIRDENCISCIEEAVAARTSCLANVEKPVIIQMKNEHIISPVIEKQVWIDDNGTDKLVSADLTKYKLDGEDLLPDQLLTFRANNGVTSFAGASLDAEGDLIPDSRYITETTFNEYGTYGNLLKQTARDGTVTEYEWGYNHSLVTASTVNAGTPYPRRTEYVHEPLVGLASTTGPNGFTTSYKYDKLNRLWNIKDNDGNILQQYWYHYALVEDELNADFTMDNPVNATDRAGFDGADNDLVYGSTLYIWDFGDGSPLHESHLYFASHVYNTSGSYSVNLTVRNPYYGEKSRTKTIQVKETLDVDICAIGVVHRDLCGVMSMILGSCTPPGFDTSSRYVTFKIDGITGGCGNLSYQWQHKFGYNGSWSSFGANPTSASITHNFSVTGNHYVRCKVTDACGFFVYSGEKSVTLYESQTGCLHSGFSASPAPGFLEYKEDGEEKKK